MLFCIARDAGSVLMHTHDRRIDHLYCRIMSCGQCVHNLVPNARTSPTNKAIVAGRIGAKRLRQIAPWRTRTQDPKDAVEDTTVIHTGHTAWLTREERPDGGPFIDREF